MFESMTIKARLITILSFVAALLRAIRGVGLKGINKNEEGLKAVYENRIIPISQIDHIEALTLQNRLGIAVSLVTPTPAVISDATAKFEWC